MGRRRSLKSVAGTKKKNGQKKRKKKNGEGGGTLMRKGCYQVLWRNGIAEGGR